MSTSDTVLTQESLRRRPDGLGIALTLPWYRSLWLSSVSNIEVAVNGEPVPADSLSAELGDRTFQLAELADQWDVLWFMQDRLVVVLPSELAPSDAAELDIEVTIDLRLPYMRIAPMKYVTNHVTNRRTLHAS